jgi:uncharacterized protein (TIGR02284 family)
LILVYFLSGFACGCAECERGEDAAKAAYEAALQKSLPADVRTLVERQYQGVKANHDRVRNLRNSAA